MEGLGCTQTGVFSEHCGRTGETPGRGFSDTRHVMHKESGEHEETHSTELGSQRPSSAFIYPPLENNKKSKSKTLGLEASSAAEPLPHTPEVLTSIPSLTVRR